MKLCFNLESYRLKTCTRNSTKLVRCTLFEALAQINGKKSSDANEYNNIWNKETVDFSEFDKFRELFGFHINIWKTSRKNKETKWHCICYDEKWSEQSLNILIDCSCDERNIQIRTNEEICWIKNDSIIRLA